MSLKNDLFLAFRAWALNSSLIPEIGFEITEKSGIPVWAAGDATGMVLNVSPEATRNFIAEDDVWHFTTRFGGAAADVSIPVSSMFWIRGRDTPFHLAFPKEMEVVEEQFFSQKTDALPPPSVETPRPRPKIVVERND